jgi:hypothetical protein
MARANVPHPQRVARFAFRQLGGLVQPGVTLLADEVGAGLGGFSTPLPLRPWSCIFAREVFLTALLAFAHGDEEVGRAGDVEKLLGKVRTSGLGL